jgi:hypothetical protein
MFLPQDVFDAVIGCASLQMEKGRGVDRRKQGRVPIPARVHVIPMSQHMAARPMFVPVRDLSLEGIGLLMTRKLVKGDNLLIRLMTKTSSFWVFCDVARAERVADGLFVIGATFNRLVEPGRLDMEHATAPAGAR